MCKVDVTAVVNEGATRVHLDADSAVSYIYT